jgi:hypothetical protein
MQNTACYLRLHQYNLTVQNRNPLELDFANFSDVSVAIGNTDLIVSDIYVFGYQSQYISSFRLAISLWFIP